MLLSRDITDILKVRPKIGFVPLLEYKRRYGCVVFGVEKLSYYPILQLVAIATVNRKCKMAAASLTDNN